MTNSDEGSPGRPTGRVCEAAWARGRGSASAALVQQGSRHAPVE